MFEPPYSASDLSLGRFQAVLDAYRWEAEAKDEDRRRQRQEISQYIADDERAVESYREAMTAEELRAEAEFIRADEAERARVAAKRARYAAEIEALNQDCRRVAPVAGSSREPHRLDLDERPRGN